MNIRNTIILLTACVNPNGMASTMLQEVKVRLEQYKKALHFYLLNTDYKILFVENTQTDFSQEFNEFINDGRLEYLTFQGNDYDKSLGKGYGEALIIKYAFDNSALIRSTEYIIKITGRVVVENLAMLCKVGNLSVDRNALIACNVRPSKKIGNSVFFVFDKRFFQIYLSSFLNKINERENIWFEHVLFESIQRCKQDGSKCIVFSRPIKILGITGTTAKPYPKITIIDYILSFIAAFLYNYCRYEDF